MDRAMKGLDILELARLHIGEPYRLGAFAPKDNPGWKGPWDCAEFASWLVYQVSGRLFGCEEDDGDPAVADAYTGYWRRDARLLNAIVSVAQAAALPGAFVLRFSRPGKTGKIGHVVVSDGQGGTVEARSHNDGVCAGRLDGRRWDTGVQIPWLAHEPAAPPVTIVTPPRPPSTLLRLGMHGDLVRQVQLALSAAGIDAGPADGIFGPHTFAAVRAFQIHRHLVPDGEVGAETLRALGVSS